VKTEERNLKSKQKSMIK